MFSSISISQFVLGSISKNRLTGPFSAHKIYILIPWLMSKDSFFFISPLLTFTESRMAYSFAPIYPLAYIHCSVWDSSVDSLMVIFTFLSVAQISNGIQISIRNKVCLMAVIIILSFNQGALVIIAMLLIVGMEDWLYVITAASP
jgi:hypothetical protein